jgi:hypothetical protein
LFDVTDAAQPILLIELNEVTNAVIDRDLARRPNSALAALLRNAARATTRLPHDGLLEPWTAWPSIHRGAPNWEHGIEALGQAPVETGHTAPPIWDVAAAAGVTVGVFGSLHARKAPPKNTAFFMPDYFSDAAASPAWLETFRAFNTRMTEQSKHNVSQAIDVRRAMGVLGCGISAKTMAAVLRQLAEELILPARRVNRRALQTRIMSDVFWKAVECELPHFSTIFINGIATALHRYWAAAWPEDFDSLPLSESFLKRYRDAIHIAFQHADPLFENAMRWARGNEGMVIIASGFGQRPVPTCHTFGFLSITDPGKFARALGLQESQHQFHRGMTPYFGFQVHPNDSEAFEDALASLRIGEHVLSSNQIALWPLSAKQVSPGFFSIYMQIDDYRGEKILHVRGKELPFHEAGIGLIRHEDGIQYSAYHTNEGAIAVYDSRRTRELPPEVDALDIAPSILRALGVGPPAQMLGFDRLFSAP